jgi:H(+)-translocating pyrophosphatase
MSLSPPDSLASYHLESGLSIHSHTTTKQRIVSQPSPPASSSSSFSPPAALPTAENFTLFRQFLGFLIFLSLFTILLALLFLTSNALYLIFVLASCIAALLFTLQLTNNVFRSDPSLVQLREMRQITAAIQSGSEGFLRVQYSSIAFIAFLVALGLSMLYWIREAPPNSSINSTTLALVTGFSYLIGAFCSALAGFIGVFINVRANFRVAAAASKLNYIEALLLTFRGGAISALLSTAFCILGLTLLYVACYICFHVFGSIPAREIPILLSGYSFGGALVALFMQLGGGIYTKAADVGADMCGKIEKGIPEDDPRNPAVIADLVGDSVGDCAGTNSDIFESVSAEILGTMILGAGLTVELGLPDDSFVFFPLVIHALDLLISGLGIFLTHPKNSSEDPLDTMKRSYTICMAVASVLFILTCRIMLANPVAPSAWVYFAGCGLVGIFTSFALIRSTQYYTDYHYAPVKRIVHASLTGHGTNVIAGIATGLESTAPPVIILSFALLSSYTLGANSGLPPHSAGIYGTAVATMGMLCTAVYVLAMNNAGPIADNAGGIVEMSGQPDAVRAITDRLDAAGNVTKAASKGFAVGGSALSCFVLFQAFLDEISALVGRNFDVVNLSKVEVLVGSLLGIMMIFLFAGWAMSAVGASAQKVVWEVRRQFKADPRILEGTALPDYQQCVSIVTKDALKEMVKPALLALLTPICTGFLFKWIGQNSGRPLLGVEVIAAFMILATLTALLMATFMDNAGGAWDNAKKFVEAQGLKGSDQHKAAVTGDTVGDPLKDTAGPALHVLITTMSTTILVLGPLFVGKVN